MDILLFYFLTVSVLAFLVNAYDKYVAKQQKRRIPETTLLTLVFFGGTLGSGLAMLLFRHKTSKTSYLLKFWLIVALQFLTISCIALDYKI